MKKLLPLTCLVLLSLSNFGQQNHTNPAKFNLLASPEISAKTKAFKNPFEKEIPFTLEISKNPRLSGQHISVLRELYVEENIGTTMNDNQSNASMPRRIINNNGKLSAVWSLGNEDDERFPNRGTAYNYYDGKKWINMPLYSDVTKIEKVEKKQNSRIGFGSIGYIPDQGEIVIAHRTNKISTRLDSNAIQISRNSAIGSQTWDTQTLEELPLLWPRFAVGGPDGKTIHLIAIALEDTINGVDVFDNMYSALLYCRSLDGGKTWDKKNVLIEGLDSNKFNGFLGDQYSIEASGNTVAFVFGSPVSSVVLFKSTDNGETWTNKDVKHFPYEPWDDQYLDFNNDNTADDDEVVQTNDGTNAIYIDNQNLVHVWYGNMFIWNSDSTDDAYTYFPGSNGIFYWNENLDTDSAIVIGGVMDDNENGKVDILLRYDQLYLDYSNNPDASVFGYDGGIGAATTPTVGVDNKGNMFVLYQACKEGKDYYHLGEVSARYGPSYRHIYMVSSNDGGKTWTTPEDVTNDENNGLNPKSEFAFPSVAKVVDEKIHLVYMNDDYAGLFVDAKNPDLHPFATFTNNNRINYMSLPNPAAIGINSPSAKSNIMTFYPNPSNGLLNINFSSAPLQKISLVITNLLGQTMMEQAIDKSTLTKNSIQLDMHTYPEGIYFISVKIGEDTQTERLVIKK